MTPDQLDEIANRDMCGSPTNVAESDRRKLLDHVGLAYAEIERLSAENHALREGRARYPTHEAQEMS